MMTKTADDNRVTFSAYILMSEGLQFNANQIEAAVREDYPTLDLEPSDAAFDQACDTDDFVTWPIFAFGKGADQCSTLLVRLPDYGTWDSAQVPQRQRILCPDLDSALAQNASYICITTGAAADDPVAAFRAARLCSCVAAIFAKLPIALACYWESGDHFMSPEVVVEMADTAIKDEWPVDMWIGVNPAHLLEDGVEQASALTVGLSAFKGVEISHPGAPIRLDQAVGMVYTTAHLMLGYGSSFKDGDTLGAEGQPPDESYRVRIVPKGTQGTPCDTILVVHPDSTADHEALAGPITSVPPPPGVDTSVHADEQFFKDKLRGGPAQ